MPTDERTRLHEALARGTRALAARQQSDGHWDVRCDVGPASTAQVLVALHHLGALAPDEAAEGARFLLGEQRADGSFGAYPFAPAGDLGATASAWAALHVCGADPAATARARDFVDAHGGAPAVIAGLGSGDLSALFVAFAGLLPAASLPAPTLSLGLLPPAVELIERRFHAGVVLMSLELGILVRRLRGEWGDGGPTDPLTRAECERALALLEVYQNRDGSWNEYTVQTAVALPTLRAIGLAADDERVARGLAWLKGQGVRTARGLRFYAFGSAVWTTAFDVRALLHAGVGADDPRVEGAVRWLLEAQLRDPQPWPNNPQRGVARTGGWGFERDNHTMPDCDDAAVALYALGRALADETRPLRPELARAVRAAFARAEAWLFGMQDQGGGFASFVHGLPGKPAGPVMTTRVSVPLDDPIKLVEALIDPPLALGDPATEDVTARVLAGLGVFGRSKHDPRVARALAFLRGQQCADGAFWGRWIVNFVAGTAFVLLGALGVAEDPDAPWLRRARRWLLEHQNDDGSFGETAASYADPSIAGRGAGVAPLTGLAASALLATGDPAARAAAVRAVRWLLDAQREDGTWSNGEYLTTVIPPDTFYLYPEAADYYPLEALGRLARTLAGDASLER